jgi:sugar phosphate isomerase/epimerase
VNGVPRLQLSTAPFYRVPLRDAMRIASAAGYRAVEVMVTNDPATQDANLVREAAEANDTPSRRSAAPFLRSRGASGERTRWQDLPSVQLAEEVGAGISWSTALPVAGPVPEVDHRAAAGSRRDPRDVAVGTCSR